MTYVIEKQSNVCFQPVTQLPVISKPDLLCKMESPGLSKLLITIKSKIFKFTPDLLKSVPMPYKTSWEENGIVWKFYGDVTAEEIENANDEFYRDERSDTTSYQIIDALEVNHVEWNDIDIKEMAAQDKGASLLLNKIRVAYISTNENITAVLEKYIEISRILNSSWEFKGFTQLESAREWATDTKSEVRTEQQ